MKIIIVVISHFPFAAGGDSNGNFKHATTSLCLPASEEGKFSTAVYANITEKNEVNVIINGYATTDFMLNFYAIGGNTVSSGLHTANLQ